jgi:lipopolysaccharide export system protein LptA
MVLRHAALALCGVCGGLSGWFWSAAVLALDTDRQQPIHIEADQLDVDDAQGVSVYRGAVKYTQGTIELTADEVTLTTNAKRELSGVIAIGKPATFRQTLDPAGGELRGESERIEYDAQTEHVVLLGSAHLWYCGDEFASSRIEYFMAQELVKASKANDGKGRVQVTIQPRESNVDGKVPCHRLKVAP